jgi:hypothetical protein
VEADKPVSRRRLCICRKADLLKNSENRHTLAFLSNFWVNMDSQIKYLLSLRAIRERANIIWDTAKAGNLNHFDFHEERLGDVADFVASIIKV